MFLVLFPFSAEKLFLVLSETQDTIFVIILINTKHNIFNKKNIVKYFI